MPVPAIHSIAQSQPLASSPYIYSLSRTAQSLASIASDDVLRFYDPSTLKIVADRSKAHEGVTCIDAWGQLNGANAVLTAGRDGKVRGWDQRVGIHSSVFMLENGGSVSSFTALSRCLRFCSSHQDDFTFHYESDLDNQCFFYAKIADQLPSCNEKWAL
jgi:WD40 repeat protein